MRERRIVAALVAFLMAVLVLPTPAPAEPAPGVGTVPGIGAPSDGRASAATSASFEFFSGEGIDSPAAMASDPAGFVWFVNRGDNTIGRIAPDGAVTTFQHPDLNDPIGIAVAPDGDVWVTEPFWSRIFQMTPDGQFTIHTADGLHGPQGIAVGPDGNMWFANSWGNSVGRITPAGAVTLFSEDGIDTPLHITAGPDGKMWFDAGSPSVGSIAMDGTIDLFEDDDELWTLGGIASGPDGRLWFTNTTERKVGSITLAGTVTTYTDDSILSPGAITAGPDGNLWFTNYGNASIGSVTTDGVISNHTHEAIEGPDSIVLGPDGGLWFSDPLKNSIGRITVGSSEPSRPQAPVGVTGTAGNGAVTVSWTAPGDDGGSPVTGYEVTASPGGSTCSTTGELTCTVGGLANGVAHTFTVTATNAEGTSDPSDPSAPVTPVAPAGAPGAPTGVVGVAGDGAVNVSWSAPTSTGGSPITGYTATSQPGGRTCTASGGVTQCSVSGLTNGVAHTFTVTATNAAGSSPASAPSAAVTPTRCGGPGVGPFPDVPAGHQFCTNIEWLAGNGISGGYGDGTFRPTAAVSRQAMAAFLYRQAGQPDVGSTPFFADVSTNHDFYEAIQWMGETGLSTGTAQPSGKPRFNTTAAVSRQAMAAFLYRQAESPDVGSTPFFADVPTSHGFYEAIQWMGETGLSTGTAQPSGRPVFNTTAAVSRQAMSAFLHRRAGA